MSHSATIKLLRFPFSFFLLPVYLFALGQVVPEHRDYPRALLIFIILHVLIYPSSNGYNSYMDRDETPIGGLSHPPPPPRKLFLTSILMDLSALALAAWIGPWFFAGLLMYVLSSRAYSWRGIRLKKLPIAGWLTVTICQGALIFFIVYYGIHTPHTLNVPVSALIASSLLVGGFYPLTQVYQHEADRRDGVRTLSMLLGIRGTFIFCAIIYALAFCTLAYYFIEESWEIKEFEVLATCMLPILVYFIGWAVQVWKNPEKADFRHTMRMNWLASACTNLGFLAVLWIQWIS